MIRHKAECFFKDDSFFVKAYLQKIVRIIRGNVYHAYIHLSGYFSVIWKAVTLLIL